MKILMIAPEPVFRVRGTPFSVRDRCRGLTRLGHTVDLLTYPFGEDFDIPGVVIHRTRRVPGIRDVKIGFSWAKIPLDALLFIKACLALRRTKYDMVHTHEEAGMMGAIFQTFFKVPHLYDMHSSLPQQFENYETSSSSIVMRFMRTAEKIILKNSRAVIAICPHLKEIAVKAVPRADVHVIENLAQTEGITPDPEAIAAVRNQYDLGDAFVVGYTGTFEVNQGLDLLIEGFKRFVSHHSNARLFLAGGTEEQIQVVKSMCKQAGIADMCRFPGRVPVDRMPEIMGACNVLTSPRKSGTNTPLKIYSYLQSGVPILATDLLTHTQVLDSDIAVLTEVAPEAIAAGLEKLYSDPNLGQRLASAAQERLEQHYSFPVYLEKLTGVVSAAVSPGKENS